MTIEREGLERDIQTLWEISTRYADLMPGGKEFNFIAQGAKELRRLLEAVERFDPRPTKVTDTAARWAK